MTDPVINDSSGAEGNSRPTATTDQPSGTTPDRPRRPDAPAPRSETAATTATPANPSSEGSPSGDGAPGEATGPDGSAKPRRRRGSRGGRGRARTGAAGEGDGTDAEGRDGAEGRGSSEGRGGAERDAAPGSTRTPRPPRAPREPREPKVETDGTGNPRSGQGGGRPPKGPGPTGRAKGGDVDGVDGASGSARPDAPRSRRAPATAPAAEGGNDRQPEELPERSFEGKPRTVEAADRAVVRKPRIGDTRPAPGTEGGSGGGGGVADNVADPGKAKSRRRRGGRGRGAGAGTGTTTGATKGKSGGGRGRSGGSAKPVEAILASGAVELDDEAFERRRGRSRNGRPVGRYLMTVSVRPQATQIAVLEGRNLIEHYVSRPSDDVAQIHGNVYLGRVQNVLPGMEAAFVDIGTPKNAVLYRGDVQYEAEDIEEKGANPRIEQILRAKQTIICQVTKNPIAHKGARLTQEVSLPGRFVVLIPNSSTYGISKRLPDDERKRLRSILDKVKPAQHGLIVRTAAEGVTDSEIQADVVRLLQQWERIEQLAKSAPPASLLYREPDMAVRVIREEFNDDYRGVVIDDKDLYEEIHGYVSAISPALADRVQLYDTDVEPLSISERHHVHEQLHKALDRKVWLPSGGSLIIEHTEALTVIDVNTGKNVGTSSLEETVFRNNLEAAIEIAKQLRLRDIGGIIVIDFIDMEIRENRDEVIKVFRDSLARDKTRTQVFDISELGLVEMTRKRIGEGLLESFSTLCPECEGRGLIIDQALID